MSRLPILPRWVLPPTMPSIYESESATALEMVSKVYGAMNELIKDYNDFVEKINKEIETFTGSEAEEIQNFKDSVNERMRIKFENLDSHLWEIRQEMKKYTDETLQKAFDMFGVAVKVTGEDIVISDASEEEIRALSLYGKTTQKWVPVPEYPADMVSVGESGTVTVKITNGKNEQLFTVATPEGLPGIPVANGGNYTDSTGQQWICDEIDLQRGVYIKRINKMVLTGEERFIRDSESWATGAYKVYTMQNNPRHIHRESMCSFLPTKPNTDLANNRADQGIGTHGNECLMVRFGADKTEEQTREMWVKAIQNGGAVYTVLQDNVERPLSAAEIAAYKKLHTYMPDTNVTTESGAGIYLEYVAIVQQFVEKIIPDYTADAINELIKAGKITVCVECDPENEELNIIAGGE